MTRLINKAAAELQAHWDWGERQFAWLDVSTDSSLRRDDNVFRSFDFNEILLSSAELHHSDFEGCEFISAKFVACKMMNCYFDYTIFDSANLDEAFLSDVSFKHASFQNASLRAAFIQDCDFTGAKLIGSDWSGVSMGGVNFVDVDLEPLCCFDRAIQHVAPSAVDVRSIVRSIHSPNIEAFLLATGMPEVFVKSNIECARSLDPLGVFKLLQSTFISYGGPDESFARTLHQALQRNGVETFFFPEHAVPGRKLHRVMRDGVNSYDRVILICSESSLQRPGVLNEIQETLLVEARQGGKESLIPISIDDYVYRKWKPEDPGVAQAVRDRVIGNFRGAETDKALFGRELVKLIGALRR